MERGPALHGLLERTGSSDPGEGLRALTRLRRELEELETEIAANARRAGWSWRQIGSALGITKQAAHRRHSGAADALDHAAEVDHPGRHVPVTHEAREAVRFAREEAAALGRRTVGTEHLLLGLLRTGDARATHALRRLGVTPQRARSAIEPTVEVSLAQEPAISPVAVHVVRQALRARAQRSGALTAGDLLLALFDDDDDGGAARTLQRLGVTPRAIRAELGRE
jgi:hypothetical protein